MEGVSEREGERVELWGGEVQREERGERGSRDGFCSGREWFEVGRRDQ